MRAWAWLCGSFLVTSAGAVGACAASGDEDTSDEDASGTTSGEGGGCAAGNCGGNGGGSGATGGSSSTSGGGDAGLDVMTSDGPPTEGEVWGHSDTTLFKLEPISKTVTTIGNFD